jgi:hypothetical protein
MAELWKRAITLYRASGIFNDHERRQELIPLVLVQICHDVGSSPHLVAQIEILMGNWGIVQLSG